MLGHHEHTISTCYCIFVDQRLKFCLSDGVTHTYKAATLSVFSDSQLDITTITIIPLFPRVPIVNREQATAHRYYLVTLDNNVLPDSPQLAFR